MSADKALERVSIITWELVKSFTDGTRSPEGSYTRSMLVVLGHVGRLMTYDQERDSTAYLYAALGDMADIAFGWAMDVSGNAALSLRGMVLTEAGRAHEKHGEHSLIGKGLTDLQRFAVLAEECGEAADMQADDARLTELIQVCSVCVSWMAWLDEQAASPAEECCRCGLGPVTYHNYQGNPFCSQCADGLPPLPREPVFHRSPDLINDVVRPVTEADVNERAAELLNTAVECAQFRNGRYEIKVSGLKQESGTRMDYTWNWFPPVTVEQAMTVQHNDEPSLASHVKAATDYIKSAYGPGGTGPKHAKDAGGAGSDWSKVKISGGPDTHSFTVPPGVTEIQVSQETTGKPWSRPLAKPDRPIDDQIAGYLAYDAQRALGRILMAPEDVKDIYDVKTAVYTALGFATKAWDKHGVLESQRLADCGQEVMGIIDAYLDIEAREHDERAERDMTELRRQVRRQLKQLYKELRAR